MPLHGAFPADRDLRGSAADVADGDGVPGVSEGAGRTHPRELALLVGSEHAGRHSGRASDRRDEVATIRGLSSR
jgi:hypothetical protein